MAITAETRTDIIELVVGMFDAAPGASVLSELTDAVDAGLSLKDLSITLANSSVFKAEYPSFLTNTEFATNYLTNFLGGNPGVVTAANFTLAVEAVVALLNSGKSRGEVVYDVVTAVSAVAETDTNFGPAAALLNNQTEVAEYYSVTTQQSGDTLSDLKAVIVNVTGADSTVVTAKAEIDNTDNFGTAFTLTTGVDTVAGTVNNDTFTAVQSATATDETFSLADSIDGGAGTDTLILTNAEAAAPNAASVSNIEKMVYRATVAGGDITLANFTSVNDLTLDRTAGANNVSGVSTSDTITFLNASATMDTTVNYSSVTGTADAATVNLNGVASGADLELAGAVETVTLNGTAVNTFADLVLDAGTTTLNVDASTFFTVVSTFTSTGVTKLTTTGAGRVNIVPVLDNATTTVDASGSTGGLRVKLGNSTAIQVTGSSAADQIQTGATYAAANTAKIDAGAGTDVLIVGDTTHLDATSEAARYTNFETLQLNNAVAVDLDLLTSISAIIMNDGAGATAATDLSATQAGAVTVSAADGAMTLTVKGAATVGQLDTLSITFSDGDTTASEDINANGSTITAGDVETFNFIAVDDIEITATTAMDDWSTINISGGGDVSLTTGAQAIVINSKIDASAATGTVTIDASSGTANGIAITGGSKADSLTGTGQADVISGGAGKDTIVGGVGADSLTGGSEVDTFTFANTATGTPTDTNFDTITDYSGDVIDGPGALTLVAEGTIGATQAAISATGLATFNAADDTLAERITAVSNAMTAATAVANETAVFTFGSDSYIFISDGTAGVGATDVLIKLTGVSATTGLTVTGGDITAVA